MCKKFRIETSDVSILTTLNQKPTEESRSRFKQLIEPFRVRSETSSKIVEEDQPPEGSTNPTPAPNENDIDDDCVEKFAKKTNRQLRINELIREHSHKVSYCNNYNITRNFMVSASVKVGCVFPMAIWPEFRMGHNRVDDLRGCASQFT